MTSEDRNHSIVKVVWFLPAVVCLMLVACGLGGGGEQGEAVGNDLLLPAQSPATLTCSQECSDRGWCGTTVDDRSVVLGNAVDPAAESHDRIFLQDTAVLIDFSNMATMQVVASGETFQLPFYHVTAIGDGKAAWVPGWCVVGVQE